MRVKVIKIVPNDALARWLDGVLPPSLVRERLSSGYGYCDYIYAADKRRGVAEKIFSMRGDPVAYVGFDKVELYHPQYFADFEALLTAYETQHPDRTVVLEYWEKA